MTRGKFIVFEGIDNSGKSTQLVRLSEHLTRKGIEHITTREPGGTYVGEKVRDILLHSPQGISINTEMHLIHAAREEHVEKIINPALGRGTWVLCDRFTHSTWAYQIIPNGLPRANLQYTKPDVVFYLRVLTEPVPNKNSDRFEKRDAEYQKKVISAYEWLVEKDDCIVPIERDNPVGNMRTIDDIAEEIFTHITPLLEG